MKMKDAEELLARLALPLRGTEFAKVFLGVLDSKHESILREGIKHGDKEEWKKLDGFRIAAGVFQKAISVEPKNRNQRVESPDPTSED